MTATVPHYYLSISYDAIATKDDRQFKRVCFSYISKWRRSSLVAECRQVFADAYLREPDDLKKENTARRTVNFYMLKEAVDYGMTNWRESQKRMSHQPQASSSLATSPYLKPVQNRYSGPSIIDMAEQHRRSSH